MSGCILGEEGRCSAVRRASRVGQVRSSGSRVTKPVVRLVPSDGTLGDDRDSARLLELLETWTALSKTVVFEVDGDDRITWCEGPLADLLGYSIDEVIGRSGSDFVHPDDRGRAVELLARGDALVGVEMRLLRKDGSTRWVSAGAQPVLDPASTVVGWRGGWQDIQAERDGREALDRSVERLRATMDSSPIGMCLVAPDGDFLEVNPALCALLGRGEEVLLATSWQDLTHPDDVAADEALVQEVVSGHRDTYRLTKRYLDPRGAVIWGDLSVGCIRDEKGDVRYFVSQIVDVSDSIRIQRELAEERARLRATLDCELDPRVVLRPVRSRGSIVDFEYLRANPRALAYFGMSADGLIGRRLTSLFPSAAAREVVAMYAEVVETGEPLVVDDYVYPNELFEGQQRFYDVRGARLGDGLSLTWRDVTDRHEAARRLSESEEHYRLLAEQTTDVVGIGDSQGFIRWVSPSVERATGWTVEELVDRPFTDIVHPDDLETVRGARRDISEDRPSTMQVRLRQRGGTYRWFDIRLDATACPRRNGDGSHRAMA